MEGARRRHRAGRDRVLLTRRSRSAVTSSAVRWSWSDELASILFLWLSMLGAVIALRRGEHMRDGRASISLVVARAREPSSGRSCAMARLLLLALIMSSAFDYAERRDRSSSRLRLGSAMPGARRRIPSASTLSSDYGGGPAGAAPIAPAFVVGALPHHAVLIVGVLARRAPCCSRSVRFVLVIFFVGVGASGIFCRRADRLLLRARDLPLSDAAHRAPIRGGGRPARRRRVVICLLLWRCRCSSSPAR